MPDLLASFEIVPHPLRGTKDAKSERIVLLPAEIRAAEGSSDEKPIVEIVSTSTGEDRHGSTIIEWDDATFMRTGHVLWQHDMIPALPYVGKKLARRQDGARSISTIELLIPAWRHIEAAHGNLPAFLWETFKVHNMGAISRGFIPIKVKPRKASTIPTELAENVEYTLVEQTEESFVNVPSNRDAFARAMARTREAGTFNDQLARTLGYSVEPYVLRTERKPAMATRTVEQFRGYVANVLTRCGYDPYREPKPDTVTDEQKAADLATMTSVITAQLASLDVAVAGWRTTSQNHLRGVLSGIVMNAMYSIEGLIWRAREWYGEDLVITVPEVADDEIDEIVAAAGADGRGFTRSVAKRHRNADLSHLAAVRAKFAELLRCCGCDPYVEPRPDLPADEAARDNEITILRTIADESLLQIETSMNGWKTAETERLRGICSDRVFSGMWMFDMCVRYLADWYSAEVEGTPNVDLAEVERSLAGVDLAGVMQRMAGPFDYASTQVNLNGDVAEKVLEFGATLIPDEALAEKGRETEPHVTVKYGIDPATTVEEVFEVVENSDTIKEIATRGALMTLGATAIFEADDYDVVIIAVDSPDLVKLNEIIAGALPVTDTQPEYAPHVTLAYVKKGEGAKYAGDETLAGTEIPFDAIVFSDTDGNQAPIPLSGEGLDAYRAAHSRSTRARAYLRIGAVFSRKNLEKIDKIIELAQDLRAAANKPTADDIPSEEERAARAQTPSTPLIRIKDTGTPPREQGGTGHSFRVLASDAPPDRGEESPAPTRSGYITLITTT